MTNETNDDIAKEDEPKGAEPREEKAEPKIMCYVSKEMVPVSKTVEVEYSHGKTFRVLPKYVKFGEKPASN